MTSSVPNLSMSVTTNCVSEGTRELKESNISSSMAAESRSLMTVTRIAKLPFLHVYAWMEV